jgi:type I restriction enzyme S subunit
MNEAQNVKQLPKGWKLVKLEEIVSILGDGLHGTPKYSETGEYFFINGNNLSDGKILIKENTKRVTISEYEKYKKPLNDKTILVSINGTLGNVAFYNKEKVILGKSACYFNVKEEVDKSYIRLLLTGQRFLNYAHNSSTGSTIQNVSLKSMREFNIPLPPKPTQQAIVSKIEELFSELDKGIENLHIAQQQLKTYRQSVLKWAFEGKLTNENVKEGELLEGWRNVSITELAEKNRHALKAGPFGSSLKKEFYVVKGYKIYGQEQVIKDNPFYGDYYVNEEKYKELSSCKIKPFDILISLVGTVGKVLLLPENCQAGIINPRLIKISLDRNVYLPKFFKYYFESSAVKSFYGAETRGTTMDVLNLGIIKTIPFPLCSIQEQEKIIKAIESRLSVADKMEESITQSLQQAEALRQSILKKAFEGRLI